MMKKFLVTFLVCVLCGFAFAGNFTIGTEQSIQYTSLSLGYDFGKVESGVKVGLGLVSGISSIIEDRNQTPEFDTDGLQTNRWQDSLEEMLCSPKVEIYAQYKLVNTEHFDMRLGLLGLARVWDSVVESKKGAYVFMYAAPSFDLSYKFNDSFRLYLNGFYPLVGTSFTLGSNPNGAVAIAEAFMIVLDGISIGASWSL